MINYLFSVAVAFILFGTIFNVFVKAELDWYDSDAMVAYWCVVLFASVIWFIVVPVAITILIVYLLKLLTDWIATSILTQIEKRKQSKLNKQEKQDV